MLLKATQADVQPSVNTHRADGAALAADVRPIDAVGSVVETTGVAEIVAAGVAAPQRRGDGAAVDTLPALCTVWVTWGRGKRCSN